MNHDEIRSEIEKQAHTVVDYTAGPHGETEFFRPHTKMGYPDAELMLDTMGLTMGALFETRNSMGVDRGIVTARPTVTVTLVEEHTIERGGAVLTKQHASRGEPQWDSMGETKLTPDTQKKDVTPLKWWEVYLDGRLEIIGDLNTMNGEWPVMDD